MKDVCIYCSPKDKKVVTWMIHDWFLFCFVMVVLDSPDLSSSLNSTFLQKSPSGPSVFQHHLLIWNLSSSDWM